MNRNFDIEFFFSTDPGRVRVSVRVRPRNGEELKSDADFADLVELLPEVPSPYLSLKSIVSYQKSKSVPP